MTPPVARGVPRGFTWECTLCAWVNGRGVFRPEQPDPYSGVSLGPTGMRGEACRPVLLTAAALKGPLYLTQVRLEVRGDDVAEDCGAFVGVVEEIVEEARVFRHLVGGINQQDAAARGDSARDVVIELLHAPP